ncbi:hypothetical protein PFUM301598_18350 [Pseudomonas fluorescens]
MEPQRRYVSVETACFPSCERRESWSLANVLIIKPRIAIIASAVTPTYSKLARNKL